MVDSSRAPDTAPPQAIRGTELAQQRGWASNDVEPPSRRTLEYLVCGVIAIEDEAPISEAPLSLTPRRLEQVLNELQALTSPSSSHR